MKTPMGIHSLCFLFSVLLFSSLCYGNDQTVLEVVGHSDCADCAKSNIKPSQAFSGLHVTIECKAPNGELKTRGEGKLDDEGKFTISLPNEIIENGKLKQDCFAQLHSASLTPCPTQNGIDSSKLIFKTKSNGKHIFTTSQKLKFSPTTCVSATFWPYFKHPPLPKWKHFPFFKKPCPPFAPYVPIYKPTPKPPVYQSPPYVKPPVYHSPPYVKPLPPPVPVYTPEPKPPVYTPKPKPPVYTPKPKPPVYTPKPKPPVYTPNPKPPVYTPNPKPPVYTPKPKPCVHKPKPKSPVYKPKPKPPVYEPKPKPPVYEPPTYVKPLPPPVPVYTKPLPPPVPISKPFPCPPFPKLPPYPKIPPKYFHHPIFAPWPPHSP